MAIEVGELAARIKLDTSPLAADVAKAVVEIQKTERAFNDAADEAREFERNVNTSFKQAGTHSAGLKGGLREVGEAFSSIKRDADVFAGSVGAAFANAADDAVSMTMALGTGGVLGVVSLVTTAVGLLATGFAQLREAEKKAAEEAVKAEQERQQAIDDTIAKMKERHKQVTDDLILEQNLRISVLEGDLEEQRALVQRLALYKEGKLANGQVDPDTNSDERITAMRRHKEELSVLADRESELAALVDERNRNLGILAKREATSAQLDLQAEQEKLKAERERVAQQSGFWATYGNAGTPTVAPTLVLGYLGEAVQRLWAVSWDNEVAASKARTDVANADKAHWDKVLADAVADGAKVATLRAQAAEAERRDAEDRLRTINEVAAAGRAWLDALGGLFSGDVRGIGSASLINGTFNTGMGFLKQVDDMKFDGAANAFVDGLTAVSDGLGKAGSAMVKEVFNIADLVGQLPTEVVGAFTNIVSVFAELFQGVMAAVQDNLDQMRRGFDDVMAGTVGLAFNKALGGGGGEAAVQNSLSVAGGFAGMGMGAAGLFMLANPVIAGALTGFGALVVFLNPVLALGAAFVAMVPAVVAVGAGLLQLSTQSKDYAQFQQAVSAVTQKAADAMGGVWRQLLPLVAVASHVVDGMGALFQVFVPNIAIAKAMFEASKALGMGLINLDIAFLKMEDVVLRVALALARLANDLGANINTDNFGTELSRVAQQTREATSARGALEGLTWGAAMAEGALLGAANAAASATESLTNVPEGYKVARARLDAQDAQAAMAGNPHAVDDGSHANHGAASDKAFFGGRGSGVVNVYVDGGNPQRVVEVVLRALDRRGYERGGQSMMLYGPQLVGR